MASDLRRNDGGFITRLNWINPEDYTFDCMLLMERFQIGIIVGISDPEYRRDLGIALKYNPKVAWYFAHRCPEAADDVARLAAEAPEAGQDEVRACEMRIIGTVEDFVIYTTPQRMDSQCDFIYGWDKARLFELCDFTDKLVLDVGSGSGRLAFAAAERAKLVIASEPVDMLREYMRDEIRRRGISNMRVCDGMCDCLPFPDGTFDVVMSGHVVGDRFQEEVAELARVVKPGGWLLDCPGDQPRKTHPSKELLEEGWEELSYTGSFGMTTYRYRKQVNP